MQVDCDPTSTPLALSSDAPPDSTPAPATTITPAAVLGETRKRKNGHQKSKKPRKKQKKFIASDDEEDSGGSPSDSDSAHSSNGDHDDHNSDSDHDDAELVPHRMRRRSTRDSARGATSPVKVDSLQATVSATSSALLPAPRPGGPLVQQAPSAPAQPAHTITSPVRSPQPTRPITTRPAIIVDEPSVQQALNTPSPTVASPVRSPQPTPSIATCPAIIVDEPSVQEAPNVPAQPVRTATSPVRSPQPTPPIATRCTFIVDDSWPDWFVKAHEHLTCPDLGPAFDGIISKYIAFEKIAGFSPEPRNAGFGSKNRPSQVAWWVGCGRKATPKITDIPAFAKQWWLWWKGLQPTWRKVAAVQGSLTSAHRAVADGEGGWADMERRGQNAFYTVLATLRWWGAALGDTCGENKEWLSAAVDVEWVLSNLLER